MLNVLAISSVFVVSFLFILKDSGKHFLFFLNNFIYSFPCVSDDINIIAGTEEELQELTTTLEMRAHAYGKEISAEKNKIIVYSRIAPISTILMNGECLEEVKSFKYLGSIISSEDDSREEIRTRINLATSTIAKLKKIWSNNNIKTSTKIRLWTLKAESD